MQRNKTSWKLIVLFNVILMPFTVTIAVAEVHDGVFVVPAADDSHAHPSAAAAASFEVQGNIDPMSFEQWVQTRNSEVHHVDHESTGCAVTDRVE